MRKLIGLGLVLLLAALSQTEPASAQSKKAMGFIEDLTSKNPKVRIAAAEGLGDLADVKLSDARSALPALHEALKDTDPAVRKTVIEALVKIEPEIKNQVPLLLNALKTDKDPMVHLAAINGLARLAQQQPQEAIPVLKKEAVPVLLEAHKASLDAKVAPPPKGDKGVPPMPRDYDPPGIRRAILNAMAQIEPDAKMRVPFLIDALKPEKDLGVRVQVINILSQVGPPAKDALPVLLEVQKASLAEAAKLSTAKGPVDLDPQGVRRAILTALGSIQPEPKEYVPILIDAMKTDKDLNVRLVAVQALARIGPPAKDALPALVDLHKAATAPTDPQGLRRAIVDALAKIQTEAKELVPLLIEILKREKDLTVRLAVVNALGEIGPPAKSALPALLDAQKASPATPKVLDPQGVRKAILETIGKLEPAPKEYVPILIDALKKDRDPAVRTVAVQALAQLGPAAKEALPALMDVQKLAKTAKEDDKALAKEAEAAVQKIQPK